MRRRLPISESPVTANDDSWDGPRRALPWPGIALADTARGLDALEFALALGLAAQQLQVPVRFHLLDFARVPEPDAQLSARLAALGTVRALRVAGDGVTAAVDANALELWVGLPALVALTPELGILLGTQRPRLEWPAALRNVGPQLALSRAQPGLARELLEALDWRGFLPVRSHSVR